MNGEKRNSGRKRKRTSSMSDDVYEVENIIEHKEDKGGSFLYKVKWKGWPLSQCTWEPIGNLRGCLETVVEYFHNIVYPGFQQIPFTSRVETLRNNLLQYSEEEFNKYVPNFMQLGSYDESDVARTENLLTLLAKLPPAARDQKLLNEVRNNLMRKKLYSRRTKQLALLKHWEAEINLLSEESAPITVVNNINLEGPPVNFMYVSKNISSVSVKVLDDPLVGCECITCSRTGCCNASSGGPVYSKGVLKVTRGTPIYECNKRCQCGPECENRVLQHGRKVPLSIFMTHNGCGWGVKTLQDIRKGEFVTEYVGEVISTEEAERRGRKYDKQGCTYLFDLDFNDKDNFPYTVDAAVYGNVSHFINHSCSPNLEVFAVWVNCLDPNMPRLGLYASRYIKSGEQLTFDYLCQPLDKDSKKRNGLDAVKNYCKCGASNCRKYLF
ncbi:hypothetical protein AAG570_011228 [Ranatra chinensis]|uniref:Histone-lysine N-methyltransferase n=1 Tax=Ranatra chinensis TaxID=642074 RepID=A0ABD0YM62_9HEMI